MFNDWNVQLATLTVNAGVAFDVLSIDFNWYVRNFYDANLIKNANVTFNGIVYQDAYWVNGWNGSVDLELDFGGVGITANATGTVTGGTVTGVLERFYDSNTILWVIQGISISASSLYQAAQTTSNADELSLVSNALSGGDKLYLSGLSDRMLGYAGNDLIMGMAGNDVLLGGTGNDVLKGGLGSDVLTGEGGNDKLIGSLGKDYFVFDSALSATTNKDTITDFVHGIDKIRLDDDVFATLPQGTLAAAKFYSGPDATAAHDTDDRIVYNTTTGTLYYDADGTGGTAAVAFAVLGTTMHPTLTATDFTIVG